MSVNLVTFSVASCLVVIGRKHICANLWVLFEFKIRVRISEIGSKVSSLYRTVSSLAKHIAISAEGLGFESRAGQIEHSVANSSPLLQRLFRAVLSRR